MHSSNYFIIACIAFAVGIGSAESLSIEKEVVILAACGSVAVFALFRSTSIRVTAVITGMLCCGMLRMQTLPAFDANPYDEYGEFGGLVVREPQILQDKQRVTLRSAQLIGDMQFSTSLQPRYHVGEELVVECVLRRPEAFESFRYDKFLQRYGVSSTCYYPSVHKRDVQRTLFGRIIEVKHWLMARLTRTLSSPENTIILGAVFGVGNAMPEYLEEAFRRTGTIHLLVISGSNVVVLTQVLLAAMVRFPLRRRNIVFAIVCILFLYAVFTGWQPPAVRATFFGSIALLASLIGRGSSALRLLVIVATVMLIINPLLLLYDAGFQLSFLATVGIIVFSKWIEDLLSWVPQTLGLRTASAVTIAATITTAPLIAYSFQTFSLVSLPANLIVGPLMTIIMLFGCVFIALAAMLSPHIASYASLPLYYVIHATLQVVEWFNRVPYASLDLPHVQLRWIAVAYAAECIMGLWIMKRQV